VDLDAQKISNLIMHLFRVLIIAAASCMFCRCKDKTSNTTRTLPNFATEENSKIERLRQLGVRLPLEGDVPFVSGAIPDAHEETSDMAILLHHLKAAGVYLSLPESIDLGMGIWRVASGDMTKAEAIVTKNGLRERLKGLDFRVSESNPSHLKQ